MKNIVNINVGLDSTAKAYIKTKKDSEVNPVVIGNVGSTNSIKLLRYKMKDGTVAEEYVQMIMTCNGGQTLYFLALKINERYLNWPSKKIIKKVSDYSVI
jgi:hypothetical protein